MAKKFVIRKNKDNEFKFNIKKNGSIEAIVIQPTDTFVFNLIELKTGTTVFTVNATIDSSVNGRIKVVIPTAATVGLIVDIGDRCDYYNRKATYKANIDCNTVDNGKFVAVLDKIYVE